MSNFYKNFAKNSILDGPTHYYFYDMMKKWQFISMQKNKGYTNPV